MWDVLSHPPQIPLLSRTAPFVLHGIAFHFDIPMIVSNTKLPLSVVPGFISICSDQRVLSNALFVPSLFSSLSRWMSRSMFPRLPHPFSVPGRSHAYPSFSFRKISSAPSRLISSACTVRALESLSPSSLLSASASLSIVHHCLP